MSVPEPTPNAVHPAEALLERAVPADMPRPVGRSAEREVVLRLQRTTNATTTPSPFFAIVEALRLLPTAVHVSPLVRWASGDSTVRAADSFSAMRTVYYVWRWLRDTNDGHPALEAYHKEVAPHIAVLRSVVDDINPYGERANTNFCGSVYLLRAWETCVYRMLGIRCDGSGDDDAMLTPLEAPSVDVMPHLPFGVRVETRPSSGQPEAKGRPAANDS
jgi:hypothetical protein